MSQDHGAALSIVIPAFNEEGGLFSVLLDLARALPAAQIIIVDDGSRDQTLQVAREAAKSNPMIRVFSHRFNRGYGASLKTGMRNASGEFVAWFDADAEHKVSDLVAMYDRIQGNPLAAVIGMRVSRSVSITRGVGKWLIRLLALLLGINRVKDLNCGLRIFRTGIIQGYTSLLPERYSASMTTTILMLERDYPIAFHPIETSPRIGASKVLHIDGLRALTKVLQLVTLFAPMRLFFRPGLFAFIIGLVYGAIITISQRSGFPTAALFMCLGGMLLCILGLIADQVSQLRLELRNSSDIVVDFTRDT